MVYEKNMDKVTYFYDVTYDKEKLQKILKKLKNYSYVTSCKGQMSGSAITKWPVTRRNILKRVYSFISSKNGISNCKLIPETVVHHTENGNNFVTYEYTFEKFPDLYYFIDIIINNKGLINYEFLYGDLAIHSNVFWNIDRIKQVALEDLLNYIYSPQLENCNIESFRELNEKNYDYKGLYELYKETLESFKFKLIAIKENVDNQEVVSGLVLQKIK